MPFAHLTSLLAELKPTSRGVWIASLFYAYRPRLINHEGTYHWTNWAKKQATLHTTKVQVVL